MNRFRLMAVLVVVLTGFWMTPGAAGQWNTPNPVVSFEKTADGVEITRRTGCCGWR